MMKRKFISLLLPIVIVLILIVMILAHKYIIVKEGIVWVKSWNGITQNACFFEADSIETANIVSKLDFMHQITPDISVRFRNGSVLQSNDKEKGVVIKPVVQGTVDIEGWFYTAHTTTGDDVIPAFSRKDFLDRLQKEVQAQLPEGSTVSIGKHFIDILYKHDKSLNQKIVSQEDRQNSKCSHIFGVLVQPISSDPKIQVSDPISGENPEVDKVDAKE